MKNHLSQLVLLTLLSVLPFSLFSQTPFPGVGSQWTQVSKDWIGNYGSPVVQQATEIVNVESTNYIKVEDYLFRAEEEMWFWMHQDSLIEHLYFDFGALEGDTVWCTHPGYPISEAGLFDEPFLSTPYMVVEAISDITDDQNQTHTVHHLYYENEWGVWATSQILNDVGNRLGLLDHCWYFNAFDGGWNELVCFTDEDGDLEFEDALPDTLESIAGTFVTNYSGCSWDIEVGLTELEEPKWELFPNPSNGCIQLGTEIPENFSGLEVYDATGRKVLTLSSKSSYELNLSSGIYFVRPIGENLDLEPRVLIVDTSM
jgi:hypothetical protein